VVLRTLRSGVRLFRRLRLSPPRVASQWRASCEKRAPHKTADATLHDCTSVGQAPVHRVPHPPFEGLRMGKGLLWAKAAYRRLQRDKQRTGTSTRSPPRPPRDPVPLARARIPRRLPIAGTLSGLLVKSPWPSPRVCAPWATRRGSTTEAGLLSAASPVFRRSPPRYSHGPTVLKRRARSLLGFLRAPLLRRQPSIPLSPACCHGHLECVRRASRGPSRQVSLAERGPGRPHKLA